MFIPGSSPSGYNRAMTATLLRTRFRSLALVLGLACMLALPAAAHDHEEHDRARQAFEQGRVLPLARVIEKVEHEQQGRVVKIEFDEEDGRYLYEIRLLQADGRMAKLKVDAVDGRVLQIKRKGR